jgi:uncharacterized protein (DUF433 family)
MSSRPSGEPAFRCSGYGPPSRSSRERSDSITLSPPKRLYTDGAEVLFDYANERSETHLLELVVVRTGQTQFTDLVRDYLQRITYGDDGWAAQLRLPTYGRADVVVDPHVAFGLPVVVHGGARVEDLVDRFLAGDTIGDIADDFDVPVDQVEDVIRLATRTAA